MPQFTTRVFWRLLVLIAFLAGASAYEATAGTKIVYVNQNAPASSSQSGTSWHNAARELRNIMGDFELELGPTNTVEYWVAAGTYLPAGQYSHQRDSSFVLQSHMRILGGFKGTETDPSQRPFFGYPTVLSGDIGNQQTNAITHLNAESTPPTINPGDPALQDNCYNVLLAQGVTDVVLDKVVIANGCASSNGVSGDYIGGMIHPLDSDGDDALQGKSITPLDPVLSGGGLFFQYQHDRAITNADLILNNCTFLNNATEGYGGGLAAQEANVEVVNCNFAQNFAAEQGGGAFFQNCKYTVIGCSFDNNGSEGSGGALQLETLPNEKTLPQATSRENFIKATGETPEDFRKYVGYAISGSMLANTVVGNFKAAYQAGGGAMKVLARTIKSSLPRNPTPAALGGEAVDEFTSTEIGFGEKFAGAYAYVTAFVSLVDLGMAITDEVDGDGADRHNSTFYVGWKAFSEGFNTYATPQGWLTLATQGLIDLAAKYGPATQSADIKARAVKLAQLNVYNQEASKYVVGCKFRNNLAGTVGGAISCTHDNIQFENCAFTQNISSGAGGAMSLSVWTTPKVINCTFYQNVSTNGDSAIVNYSHARAQIINSTFYQNQSFNSNGCAIGVILGSEVSVYNSILWGNTSLTQTNGGADLSVSTKALVAQDSKLLTQYNAAGDGYGDWIGICDVANSCVQSLRQVPLGTDKVILFTEPRNYSDAEIAAIMKNKQAAEDHGPLISYGFINVGEGIRPTLLDTSKHNIDADPLLDANLIPSKFSPVIDTGSNLRLNNNINISLTGVDILNATRTAGASIDMGAVENQNGFGRDEIVYVRPAATGNGSGSSWSNALGNLQTALSIAGPHQVWVAAGTYYPTTGSDRTISFSLTDRVVVYGGFTGTETNVNQRNWQVNQTILSGDIGARGNDSDNSYHVVFNTTGVDLRALLDGFYITKGRANGVGGQRFGAAIYNSDASPTIQNCVFVDNQASENGGAIYSSSLEGSPISFCQFTNNTAGGYGGAIDYLGSRLWMKVCRFDKNTSAAGGGLAIGDSDVAYLYGCLFAGNTVSGPQATGGAIQSTFTDLRLYNCTFTLNTVTASNSFGGGAINLAGTGQSLGTLRNCILWNNTATNTSGAKPSLEFQQISLPANSKPFMDYCLVEGLDAFVGSSSSSNIDVDPQFVNSSAWNFRLMAASPAIDSGLDSTGYGFPTVDLDKNPRLANVTMDLGAYEFQGTPLKANYKIDLTQNCDTLGAVYNIQLTGTNSAAASYQWQVNKDDGAGWVSVSDGGVYSGATTVNLAIVHPSVTLNGYRYRLGITLEGAHYTSTAVTLQVSRSLLYVRSNATGAKDGSTWGNAYTDLQTALKNAASCSQIWVASGTYVPGTNISSTFRMKPNVAIYGGFAGTETNLTQRSWRTNVSVLSGNIRGGGNVQQIVYSDSNQIDSDAILDGFTLTGATNTAIYIFTGSPKVRNCSFVNNFGDTGGALRVDFGASPSIENCIMANNTSGQGGAVYCSSSSPKFFNCLLYGNRSTYWGGAITSFRSTLQLTSCTVADNSAKFNGGGLYQQEGTNQIANCILWNNKDGNRTGTLASKQALIEFGGSQTITNCVWQGSTNGNLPFDPLFSNTGANNYRLSPFSPAIDAGNNAFAIGMTNDADGNSRVFGSAVDIGAYEYRAAPSNSLYLLLAPQSVQLCDLSQAVVFTVQGTNSGTNFQWQVNSGTGFVSLPASNYLVSISGNTSTLTITNVSPAMNGWQYRALTGTAGAATPPATLSVYSPTIIYVNAAVSGGTYNGSSWLHAFPTLQAALDVADTCDEIWVARGTYTPTVNPNGVASYRLKSGVGIYGGFYGYETTRNQRDWVALPTYLAPTTNTSVIFDNNAYAGGTIDATAVLDGFTFANLTNVIGIANSYASPTIRNCFFTGNNSYSIIDDTSSALITSCTFSNNTGVPLYNRFGAVTISGCTFINNNVGGLSSGSAISNQGGTPAVNGCKFTNNIGNWGGAIYNISGAALTVSQSIFVDNSSGNGGAIFNGQSGSASILNCLFEGNASPYFRGGAISHFGASMLVENCTVANNYAQFSGGGLYNQGNKLVVKNSIFWGNALTGVWKNSPDLIQIDNSVSQAPTQVIASDVQGLAAFAGNGNFGYDPLFSNAAGGDFTLTAYSPATDSGTNDTDVTTADLLGNARVFGPAVDIGAYERQSAGAGTVRFLSSATAQSTCSGSTAQFSVVGSLTNAYTYQWQQLVGSNFVNVGAGTVVLNSNNTSTLQITTPNVSQDGSVFRFLVNGTGYASPNVTLTVLAPRIIYVNISNSVAGAGNSWGSAFKNVQDAIDNSDSCSEIWVARGDYYLTNSSGVGYSLQMKQGSQIYAGFFGFETQRSQRNWQLYPTILHAAPGISVLNNLGYLNPVDTTATFDGFTVSGQGYYAIQNVTASPTIQNCTIINTNGGGVMNTERSSPIFINCVFSNNVASAMNSSPRSSPVVMNSVFIKNRSSFRGGAIYNGSGDLQLIDCRFTNNVCTVESGGAICQEGDGLLTCTRCIFSGNSANDGGAMFLLNGKANLADCLFVDNAATTFRAGSIDVAGSRLVMNNCTVVRNSAGLDGGGLYLNQGNLTATNTAFWFNVDHARGSTLEQQQISGNQPVVSLVKCSVQGLNQYAGAGNLAYDPLFVNINSNNFSLNLVSPLINAGNNSGTNQSNLDLANNPRLVSTNVDIGTYEQQTTTIPVSLKLLTGPQSQFICAGSSAIFALIGDSNSTLSVTWQVDTGSGFGNVIPSGTFIISTNAYSSSLIVSNATASQNGFQFRYVVGGGTFVSVPVSLFVSPRPIIYVNVANSNPVQAGTNWSTAFTNLQTALAAADSCSEIWVAKGTYVPLYYPGLNSYSLERGAQMYGGFAGIETNRTQRNWANNPTILLGNGQGAVIYNSGYNNLMDGTTLLDGFTITSTNTQAGILNFTASPTIRNCTFANNYGYALDVIDGNPVVDNCVFISNHFASVDIRSSATPTFSNCLFTNNSTVQGNVQIFGQSSPTFNSCLFINNTDSSYGAGIFADNSSFTVANCRFASNRASSGPCLEMNSSTGVLINSLMANNTATFRAGAIEEGHSSLRIINSTISRNTGANYAGGILSYQSTNTVLNSILWANLDSDGSPSLTSQQLYLNSTSDVVLQTNSCIEGSTNTLSGNMGYNPLFADEVNGDFTLGPNSPAINTGNNSLVAGYNTDLAENNRIQLTNVDMGCYESATAQTPYYLQGTPGSQAHCVGDVAIFTYTISNVSPASLSWLYSTNVNFTGFGSSGSQLFGPPFGTYTLSNTATSTSLIVSNITQGMNGYRFKVLSLSSPFVSSPVTLFVNSGSTIFVNAEAVPGGDGFSWATAYRSLQVALANASPCRPTIWVAKGTYYPTATTNQNTAFELVAGTTLLGGFAGTETNSNQRNWTLNPVVLSGDLGVPGDTSDNSSVVVAAHSAGANTILDGFIIEQGTNGGVVVDQGSPTIQNCVIRSNYNGGLLFLNTTPVLQNCTVTGNIGSSGGGLASFSSSPIIKNCIFSGNTGTNGGGGLYIQDGSPQILNCLITGNKGVNGGGISRVSANGTLTIVNSTISGNSVTFTSGGGVFGGPGLTKIDSSILWGNIATGPISQESQFNTSFGGTSNIDNSCIQNLTFTPFNNFNTGDDPLFLAPLPASSTPFAGGDFHVAACSPVIDAGNSFGLNGTGISQDLNGLPRVHGRIDIGCYEFQTTASSTLRVTLQPVSFTNCSSASDAFQITAVGSGLSYQWEGNFQDGNGFVSLNDDVTFIGTSTATLMFNNSTFALNQSQYRCLVTSSSGCSVRSQAATLTVKPPRLYVNASAAAGGNGLTWSTAFQTIQQALNSPQVDKCNGEIWVAAGKYYPSYSNDKTAVLQMQKHLAIYGGFNGTETLLYQRDWVLNPTIISGDIGVAGDHNDDSNLLIANNGNVNPVDNSGRLDGFILEYGVGGIFNVNNTTPTISHCVFRNFSSSAINNQSISSSQSIIIEDCSFLNNGNSSAHGSGIYNSAASPIVRRCEFRGNVADSGAGMDSENFSFPLVMDCIFSGNSATIGAGSYCASSSLRFRNCTFVGNNASATGGGFFANSVDFYNCIFWKNKDSSGYTLGAQYSTTLAGSPPESNNDIQGLTFLGQNISSDPLFVLGIDATDAPTTNGDFHLSSCSPAINSGINSSVTDSIDVAGNDRIIGGTVDMGAYENAAIQLGVAVQPVDQSGGPTSSVQFSVVPTLDFCSFQWQVNKGSGFVNITNGPNYSGATAATVTFTNLTLAAHSNQFRCQIQSPFGCQVTSLAAAFHFLPAGGPPSIQGAQNISIVENSTNTISVYSAVSPDNLTTTLSMAGTDSALFRINGGGALSFKSPPNFSAPADANHDNFYNLTFIVTDQVGQTGSLAVVVQVLYDFNKVYFVTVPVTNATAGVFYNYEFNATGPQPENIAYSAPILPSWLQLTSNVSVVTTVAGSGESGADNGVSTNASFSNPNNVVVDTNGNVIVADTSNQALRKIAPDGTVTTLPAYVGYVNDVAIDAAGNLYTANFTDNQIMKISPDGSNSVSLATVPFVGRLAVDASGTNIYFNGLGHAIYRYQPATGVTLFAGNESAGGLVDGVASSARFTYPRGLAVDGSGKIYVADMYNHAIRVITPEGAVTTLAGGYGQGYRDGIGTNAIFDTPQSVAIDGAGTVYVGDFSNNRIRRISPAGVVTTLAGSTDSGAQDGPALQSSFFRLSGVAVDNAGTYVYVADTGNNLIRKVKTASAAIFGTPSVADAGNASVTLVANDGTRSANQSFGITVSPGNRAPVAVNQFYFVDEDSTLGISLTATDADGDSLTYTVVQQTTNGTLAGTAPNLIYHPNTNYNGPDHLTFFAQDGRTNSAIATVTITVEPVNDAPVANAQSVTVYRNTSTPITLTGSDVDGDTLFYYANGFPIHGTLTGGEPDLIYTPFTNYVGTDRIIFSVGDGHLFSPQVQVSINVIRTNAAPVAFSQSITNTEDSSINITLASSDADGDPVTYTLTNSPAHGTLTGTLPNLVYSPATNYYGTDSFAYVVNDGITNSDVATVSITITSVNDSPLAGNTNATVFRGQSVNIPVLVNASDVENDSLTISSVTQGTNGTVTFTTTNVTYTATAGATGLSDSFAYQITDGNGGYATGLVSIVIFDSNLIVTTNTDSGPGSLRAAIDAAKASPTGLTYRISFAAGLAGQTISLTTIGDSGFGDSAFVIDRPIVITAEGVPGIVVQRDIAAAAMRVFRVATNGDLSVKALTIRGGAAHGGNGGGGRGGGGGGAGIGGGILNEGRLALENTALISNLAAGGFGGAFDSTSNHGSAGGPGAPGSFAGGGIGTSGGESGHAGLGGFGGGNGSGSVRMDQGIATGTDGGLGGGGGAGDLGGGGGGAGLGGGVFNRGGIVIISNCVVATNIVVGGSGGAGSIPDFNGIDGSGFGGGLFNFNGTMTVTNSVVFGNNATDGGGIYNLSDSGVASLNVDETTMSNSSTDLKGGFLKSGLAQTFAHGNSLFMVPVPGFVNPGDKTTQSNVVVGLTLSAAVTGSYSVDATSDNQTLLPNGGLIMTGSGTNRTLTVTPASGQVGQGIVTVKVTDEGATYSDFFTVNVLAKTNEPPVAFSDRVTIVVGQIFTYSPLAYCSDPDLDPLVISGVTQGAHGTVSFTTTNITYAHDHTLSTNDSFTYTVSDGKGGFATAPVLVTIIQLPNSNPFPFDDSATINPGDTVALPVLSNDFDPDQDPLVVSAVTQGAHGTVSFTSTNVTYIHDHSAGSTDSFTYTVTDTRGGSATGTVHITINSSNRNPVAQDDTLTVARGGTNAVPVLNNDSDPDGDLISIYSVGTASHGWVSITGKQITYVHDNSPQSTDLFTYTITDGKGGFASGTVYVTISAVNHNPVAQNDTMTVPPGATRAVSVLNNDFDADGDFLSISSVGTALHGFVSIAGNQITYMHDNSSSTSDSFTYTISDGKGGSASATVFVTISSNQNPLAFDDYPVVLPGGSSEIFVLQNDFDPDFDFLTITNVTQGTHGLVTFTPTSVTYTNTDSAFASDSFTYTVSDGHGGSSTATVFVTLVDPGLVVTQAGDSGPGSLRAAINTANFGPPNVNWTITFAPELAGSRIALTSADDNGFGASAFSINSTIEIVGDPAAHITIARDQAAAAMRLFRVSQFGSLRLSGLTLTNGLSVGDSGFDGSGGGGGGAGLGGAIYSEGNLLVENCNLALNTAVGGRGGNSVFSSFGGNGGGLSGGSGTNSSAGGFASGGGGGLPGASAGQPSSGGFGGGNGAGTPGSSVPPGGNGGFGGGGGGGNASGGGGGVGAGGAIFNRGGFVNILFSSLSNNVATGGLGGSGAISSYNGEAGRGLGGSIFNYSGFFDLSNDRLVDNTADQGGGLFTLQDGNLGFVSLDHVTMTNLAGGTNLVVMTANSGQYTIIGYRNSILSQTTPYLDDVPDQSVGPNWSIPVHLSLPTNPGTVNIGASGDVPTIYSPKGGISVSGTGSNRQLNLVASPGASGAVNVTANLAVGTITYSTHFLVTVTLHAVAQNDFASTDQNTPTTIAVLGNDSPVGQVNVISFTTNSLKGTLVYNPNGTFTYNPNSKFTVLPLGQTAIETFTYAISDGSFTSSATVYITVTGLNDLPVAIPVQISRFPGNRLVQIPLDLLRSHAFDPDNETLTLGTLPASSQLGVSIAKSSTSLTYLTSQPLADDSFKYTIQDQSGGVVTNTVFITVITNAVPGLIQVVAEGADRVLDVTGTSGHSYQYQYKADMNQTTWQTLGTASEGPSGYFYFRDFAPTNTARFYRVIEVVP